MPITAPDDHLKYEAICELDCVDCMPGVVRISVQQSSGNTKTEHGIIISTQCKDKENK